MADAAAQLNLHFNSFKKRALELGCYQTNQAGLGLNKKMPKVPLDEIIIENKHPHFQTFKLKKRLILEGVKSNQCESCGISEWQGKPIEMELHHLDGNRFNHQIQNLLILCPNCHSQTPTFRAKNKKI
ncbi:MAG: HNH endonuclease signature motif containing protein [Bacteroidota bacterium]